MTTAGRRAILVGAAATLAGCSMPTPEYQDSLTGLANLPGANAPLDAPAKAGPTVTLVLGSNIERLLQYRDDEFKWARSIPGTIINHRAEKDQDVQYIITGAVQILRARYPSMESVDDLASAAKRGFASSIVLDITAKLGEHFRDTTSTTITAILFDAKQNPVSRLQTSATLTIRFGEMTHRMKEASDIALAAFREKVERYWS